MSETWEERCERIRRVVDEAITDVAMANLAGYMEGDEETLGYLAYERLEALPIEDLSLAIVMLAHDTGLVQQRLNRLQRQVQRLRS